VRRAVITPVFIETRAPARSERKADRAIEKTRRACRQRVRERHPLDSLSLYLSIYLSLCLSLLTERSDFTVLDAATGLSKNIARLAVSFFVSSSSFLSLK